MATVFKQQKDKKDKAEGIVTKSSDDKIFKNKQRVLLLSSRGINSRQRHLLTDLGNLLPHSKKDAKLDSKSKLYIINELADLNNCNNCIFFEVRKRQDLYMWISKTPNGPSMKFHVQNIHTMEELKMTGNCLKGSRHILSFDKNFESTPHWMLMKELFTQVFGVPKTSRRIKPFIDHVISFSIVDNRVWFRNYQITEKPIEHRSPTDTTDLTLVEIGPRFVMNPIRTFDGSFGGQTAFENPEFISPNVARAHIRNAKANRYKDRMEAIAKRDAKMKDAVLPDDPLSDKNVFA
ncbi:Ribosome biogenesis protein brx1 [Lobosporangium transversale]|uniref:Brix domain-domain-containing protein n=1 Tax=Lobosporangium transversale TaxID=64571 RepID=A0A1Y2GR55_9FUNG|nr:Brix domain-domain-containing protein [Lobosporangium transversale]KAF9898068.1 Ribosome biogenesis protein brx1 [Lobosporangium transversale]ORZ20015.1 Brix domain-domain-containing protein [Lobosporangium transversale]|eukprot:XP_021882555.1 Brix domain-domain-containing protein [Lobosporangium transversale]